MDADGCTISKVGKIRGRTIILVKTTMAHYLSNLGVDCKGPLTVTRLVAQKRVKYRYR